MPDSDSGKRAGRPRKTDLGATSPRRRGRPPKGNAVDPAMKSAVAITEGIHRLVAENRELRALNAALKGQLDQIEKAISSASVTAKASTSRRVGAVPGARKAPAVKRTQRPRRPSSPEVVERRREALKKARQALAARRAAGKSA